MAEAEWVSHSGIYNTSVLETEEFYEKVLGVSHSRMSGSRTCVFPGDYQLLFFLTEKNLLAQPPDEERQSSGVRHGFAVPHSKFQGMVERIRENDIPFEGPLEHPKGGPLGESVYLRDPGGNFLEICWRRDEGQTYHPVLALEAD